MAIFRRRASSCAKNLFSPIFPLLETLSSNGYDMTLPLPGNPFCFSLPLKFNILFFFLPPFLPLLWGAFFPRIDGTQRHALGGGFPAEISSPSLRTWYISFFLLSNGVRETRQGLTSSCMGKVNEKNRDMDIFLPFLTTAIGSNCSTRTPPPRTSREPERQLCQYKERNRKSDREPPSQPTNLNPTPASLLQLGLSPSLFRDTPESSTLHYSNTKEESRTTGS